MDIRENVDLKDYTSLRTGGRAKRLITIEEGSSLAEVITRQPVGEPIWVLGFGTNCLISDKGLPGTVILNRSGLIEKIGPTVLKASSGANWDDLIQLVIAEELWGLEFTSAIPGGVGAAIAGNIAAYGHQVADHFVSATILDLVSRKTEVWAKEKFNFNYRCSSLQLPENRHKVVLDATFELSPKPTGELKYDSALKVAQDLGVPGDTLANRRQIILETRRRADALLNDPAHGPWTAGSFFRNPLVDEQQVEAIIAHEETTDKTKEQILAQNLVHGQDKARVSASHVLLAAGFKRGQTWGRVRLDPDHILKIENMGNATSQEIYEVAHNIIDTVMQRLGISLEAEVRFLGEF